MKTHFFRALLAFVVTFSISLGACFAGNLQQEFNKVIGAAAVADGVTSIDVPLMLLKINASISIENDEAELLIEKIDKLNILVFSSEETSKTSFNAYKKEMQLFSQSHAVATVLSEKDGDNMVKLKSISENGVISNLVMEVEGSENVIIHMKGNFTQKDVQHLTKLMKQSKP